jgi:hypothetical protein
MIKKRTRAITVDLLLKGFAAPEAGVFVFDFAGRRVDPFADFRRGCALRLSHATRRF